MKKAISNFLLLNLLVIALAIVIYAAGYEYDNANKLYPELYYFAYDASITVYGKRWERISTVLIVICGLIDVVALFIWIRNKQKTNKNILDLTKEKL